MGEHDHRVRTVTVGGGRPGLDHTCLDRHGRVEDLHLHDPPGRGGAFVEVLSRTTGIGPCRDRHADAECSGRLVQGPPFARRACRRDLGVVAPDSVSLGLSDCSSRRRRAEMSVPGRRRARRQGQRGDEKDDNACSSRRPRPGRDSIPPDCEGLHDSNLPAPGATQKSGQARSRDQRCNEFIGVARSLPPQRL